MPVDVHSEGSVATLTLNRPEKLNALDPEMRRQLIEALTTLSVDDDVRAILIRGEGRGFCSGADVTTMGAKRDILGSRTIIQRNAHTYIKLLHNIEKPVIASVRGPAAGVGWSLALACDFILASDTATFHPVFTNLGIAPDGGLAWFLSRQIGMARAKELIYFAKPVPADQALALGLVNHVIADDNLDETANTMVEELAERPTFALGLSKKLIHLSHKPSLEEFFEAEAFVQPTLFASADSKEGVQAFKEKRAPAFSGR